MNKIKHEPAVVAGAITGVLNAILISLISLGIIDMPTEQADLFVAAVGTIIVTLAGAFVVRSQVRPVIKDKEEVE